MCLFEGTVHPSSFSDSDQTVYAIVLLISNTSSMPPIPSLPNDIAVRKVYDEGSYRLNLLVAGADIESQCLGYSTLVWYADKQPSPEASEEKRQVRTQIKAYRALVGDFHYECKIVSGGTIKYDGIQEYVCLLIVNTTADYLSAQNMSASMGTKYNGNLLEMPAHPRYVQFNSIQLTDIE